MTEEQKRVVVNLLDRVVEEKFSYTSERDISFGAL